MARRRISLDGSWSFYTDPGANLTPEKLSEEAPIPANVPAPWQALSPELRHYAGTTWYRRSFQIPPDWLAEGAEQVVILGFGAVDYFAEVWVNELPVGEHEGGYLPFELDITQAVNPGDNTLTVRVRDPLEIFPEIPHGKQSWYGLISGIWQTVWLESRPQSHILQVHVTPRANQGQVAVQVELNRALTETEALRMEIYSPAGELAASKTTKQVSEILPVQNPLLWDLDTPNLYTLRVILEGSQPDEVSETFGFRTVETQNGRILLNGQPIFLRGALDQDYYPDLICTPPSDEFLEDQFRKAKAMGLNCLRTHIKIADPRYYAAADRIGLLIWTELPNWKTLTPDAMRRARETLAGMVRRDWNHPSIIIWTVVNESWGIDMTDSDQRAWLVETYDFLKELDPTRLVVGNSACWDNFQVVTDLEDFHIYYAIPDHYKKWRSWVRNFASRASWTYAHEYQDYARWRAFHRNPWKKNAHPPAPEVRRRGDEPLILSEFGNWGLPDVRKIYRHYGGEPWWFHTGYEWGEGVVYPHGVEERFRAYHLDRVFPTLQDLTQASQRLQMEALKFEIEQTRRQETIGGYVITEFTDVHWESNGLLDMCRNLKVVAEEISSVNAEDVIIPDWQRLTYWEGDSCQIDIYLSHYSSEDLHDSRLAWHLDLRPDVCGSFRGLGPAQGSLTRIGRIKFEAPQIRKNHPVQLKLRLFKQDGTLSAANRLELFFYPRGQGEVLPMRIFAPELAPSLHSLGYQVVEDLEAADVVVALTLTDQLRRYLLSGGRVLWLAESERAQQTYLGHLKIYPRREKVFQGDWANSLSWICQDRIFSDLPVRGLLNFAFADLTPENIIKGLSPTDFAHHVHAGWAVGWLHKVSGVVAEQTIGRGKLLVSTFQLSKQLNTHPLAAILMRDMLKYLFQEGRGIS